MTMTRYDCAVVGGGIAGLAIAEVFAQSAFIRGPQVDAFEQT